VIQEWPGKLSESHCDTETSATLRRLGKLLELEGVKDSILRKLEHKLAPSSALIPWVPTLPKRGTADRRWGVIVNYEP